MHTEILVEELAPQAANVIVEHSQDNSNKTLWINGVFMESELKNRNGRVYPLAEMKKAVADMQQRIKENNGVFGELDHPTISGPGSLNISLPISKWKVPRRSAAQKSCQRQWVTLHAH